MDTVTSFILPIYIAYCKLLVNMELKSDKQVAKSIYCFCFTVCVDASLGNIHSQSFMVVCGKTAYFRGVIPDDPEAFKFNKEVLKAI